MKVTYKKNRKGQRRFNVEFSDSDLKKFNDYGFEAKCVLMMDPPDTSDYIFENIFIEETKSRITIDFTYEKSNNENIFIDFRLIFDSSSFYLKKVELNHHESIDPNTVFTKQFISDTQQHIKALVESIFDRPNKGGLCKDCLWKHKMNLVPYCKHFYSQKPNFSKS